MKPEVLNYFEERFGIPKSAFSGFRLYSDQKGRILLGPKSVPVADLAISIGMQAARINGDIKPTTNFLQLFGKHATRNIIHLTKEQVQAYLKGEDVELKESPATATEGYVLLRYLDYPLCCGMLKNKTIKNVLAKSRRTDIKFM